MTLVSQHEILKKLGFENFEDQIRHEKKFFFDGIFFLSSSTKSGDSIGTVFRAVWMRKTSQFPLANMFFKKSSK